MTNFGFRRVAAREKGTLVRSHFDAVAKRYDLMNTLLSFGIHYLWKRTAIEILQLKEGETVLDICGGTGDLSVLAAKRIGPSGRIVLYDINRAMMEAGRCKSTHAAERSRILYVQGDAERAALASGSFDAAMVGFGIRNLTDREEGLREIHRVLKPGGRFVCLEFSQPTACLVPLPVRFLLLPHHADPGTSLRRIDARPTPIFPSPSGSFPPRRNCRASWRRSGFAEIAIAGSPTASPASIRG